MHTFQYSSVWHSLFGLCLQNTVLQQQQLLGHYPKLIVVKFITLQRNRIFVRSVYKKCASVCVCSSEGGLLPLFSATAISKTLIKSQRAFEFLAIFYQITVDLSTIYGVVIYRCHLLRCHRLQMNEKCCSSGQSVSEAREREREREREFIAIITTKVRHCCCCCQ